MIAITRPPTGALARCELTYLDRQPIDLTRALEQHRRYEETLRALGVNVVRLPAEDDMPDACFVEDTVCVLNEVAIMANPGAASRRGEIASVAKALESLRKITRVAGDATFDGGDVLRVGSTVFVGQTKNGRTNQAGAEAISDVAVPLGYTVRVIPFDGCLHLKSAATQLGEKAVIVNHDWVDPSAFALLKVVCASPREPSGADVLLVGDMVIAAASAPETVETIKRAGYQTKTLDVSEFEKAEAALTCLSILV